MLEEFMQSRIPTADELRLIDFLIHTASVEIPNNWQARLMVKPQNDGQMGGLLLSVNRFENKGRIFGQQISECSFIDSDGFKVIASLYIDQYNDLYELDIWKVDYSPLLNIPEVFNSDL